MPSWITSLTMLPDRARNALLSVWDALTQERQQEIETEMNTGAQDLAAMEERVMAELATQEHMLADLTELVARTEKKVDALEEHHRGEDEDAATLSATERALDSFQNEPQ